MPQAWVTRTPYWVSKLSVMMRGQAEPPMPTCFRVESFLPLVCMNCSSPSQTVGTAADMVTASSSSSEWTEAPSSFGPGMTSDAPTMGAEKASDHELA